MIEVYLFSIFWLCFSAFTLYEVIRKNVLEKEDMNFFDELMDLERFIAPQMVSKLILICTMGVLAVDILGFYLSYYYAYESVNDIYYRIMFFLVCACIFLVDQGLGLRYTVRMSSAIKKLEEKPNVLQRWISMNDPGQETLANLAALAKFTIALQLFLFTVISSL